MRRPAVAVRRRAIAGLHAAGYTDLQPGHLAVFAWPGPDGQRPGVLAVRADASKQAMNHLLGQLEAQGYIVRKPDPADRRTRIVQLTRRGAKAWAVLEKINADVEAEWLETLGKEAYADLQQALVVLNEHFDDHPVNGNNHHHD